jgi:catechol 2,3-dioxygenase-like lactoylglutathione lyase family enzyme
MLHHVSVGVSDLARAALFYDAVLGALGYKRVVEVLPYGIAYGETAPVFWVQLPHDQSAAASAGNGVHVGFVGRSKAVIELFHRAALEAGGRDEGSPGPRPHYGPHYFGAFVRDLDGNKLEAVLVVPPAAPSARPARKTQAKKTPPKKTAAKRIPPKNRRKAKIAKRAGKSAQKSSKKTRRAGARRTRR